ncbi:hypothetical protein [Streptomyces sp. NPDC096324]|uniref:hypothetical protein n=1 Tax=Streptomyces sp. NPDC096324 TaxID=3366085 RepID=UPI00381570A3
MDGNEFPLVDVVVVSPCSTTPHRFRTPALSDGLRTLDLSGFSKMRAAPTLAAQEHTPVADWPKRRRSGNCVCQTDIRGLLVKGLGWAAARCAVSKTAARVLASVIRPSPHITTASSNATQRSSMPASLASRRCSPVLRSQAR